MSDQSGVKYDAGKPEVVKGALHYFPNALAAVADVSAAGARKYAWDGWRTVPDGVDRYTEAMGRHLLAEREGPTDSGPGGTGCLHAAQVAWNALARLELMLLETEYPATDDNRGNQWPESLTGKLGC